MNKVKKVNKTKRLERLFYQTLVDCRLGALRDMETAKMLAKVCRDEKLEFVCTESTSGLKYTEPIDMEVIK